MSKTTAKKTATETKAPAPKAETKAPKAERIEKNGVRAPTGRPGVVFAIWSHCAANPKLDTSDLAALAEEQGWSLNLLRSWHRQFRKFNGLPVGRATKAETTPEKPAPAKKAPAKKAA